MSKAKFNQTIFCLIIVTTSVEVLLYSLIDAPLIYISLSSPVLFLIHQWIKNCAIRYSFIYLDILRRIYYVSMPNQHLVCLPLWRNYRLSIYSVHQYLLFNIPSTQILLQYSVSIQKCFTACVFYPQSKCVLYKSLTYVS